MGGAPRLQRSVGVSYKPETERQSHYGQLMLPRCYDQVVFIDRLCCACAVLCVAVPDAACVRLLLCCVCCSNLK